MKPGSSYKGRFQMGGKLSKAISTAQQQGIDATKTMQTAPPYEAHRQTWPGIKTRRRYVFIAKPPAPLRQGTPYMENIAMSDAHVFASRHLAGHMRLSTLAIHPYAPVEH
jgi:hypothetical protein